MLRQCLNNAEQTLVSVGVETLGEGGFVWSELSSLYWSNLLNDL